MGFRIHFSSRGVPKRKATRVGAAFFAIFLLVGLGILIPMFVLPLVRIAQARSWTEVPCTIVSSQVVSERGRKSTTYRIDIAYQYVVSGQLYKSSRHNFTSFSSSGRSGKQAVVNRYRPGTKAVCYVDPSDPANAVLNRGFTADLLFGLIPLVFVGVGAVGMIASLRSGRGKDSGAPAWQPAPRARPASAWAAARGTGGPVVLKSAASPMAKLLGSIAVAVFWNGIVSIFLTEVVSDWLSGKPDMCMTAFLLPFVVIGVLLIVLVIYCALALLNPRVKLAVNTVRVHMGDELALGWQFSGRCDRIAKLIISLEGREKASYRQGKNTKTDESVFARIPIVEADTPAQIQQGKAAVRIPDDTMHSFDGSSHKILWTLVVRGQIPNWPDVEEKYEIAVLPVRISEEAAV